MKTMILGCLLIGNALSIPAYSALETKEWHFTPPANSGVANVKDYGAKGDGVTDDTQAILKAISGNIDKSRYRANPFIWFPNGTYLVSDSIEGRVIAEGREEGKVWSAGWRSMFILIGETRSGAVIKLKDKTAGFVDPAKPKWLIATGSEHDDRKSLAGGGNRAFRHNILNLTVDVGDDNPGAIGIDFVANNRGSIDGVTLRSGKNSGLAAINLTRWWPGPAMVLDVSIEGFDHAFRVDHYQYGMTFENITIKNTRKTAVTNTNNVLVMRNVQYSGDQSFYEAKGDQSMLCLLDSTLNFTGSGEKSAILSGGLINLRRVTTTGYSMILDDLSKGNKDLAAKAGEPSKIVSYDQGPTLTNSGQTPASLNLPIDEIPTIRPPDGAAWTDSGADSDSLQAVIDSGAEYIYLKPVTTVKFTKPVILRNKVRLIMGLHGCIEGPGDGKIPAEDRPAAFIMGETGTSTVCLEHIFIGGRVENPSNRTLVLRHVDIEASGLRANGSGKTHVIDVIGRNYHIGPKHHFYARQLNAEFGSDPLFTNSGNSVVLGFKMETSPSGSKDAALSTPSLLNLSGNLEVFGGLLYTLGGKKEDAPKVPAFTNTHGKLSVSYRINGRPETHYPIILRQGSFKDGKDISASVIKGPGAALLFDQR